MSNYGTVKYFEPPTSSEPSSPEPSLPEPKPQTFTYEDIASSKPFLFSIGPKRREFTVHSVLIANQSPALDRLVNGNFKEAQDNHAELDSVDEDTFICFIQYAYTSRYGTEGLEGADPRSGEFDKSSILDEWRAPISSKVKKKGKKGGAEPDSYAFELNGARKIKLWDQFTRRVSALHVSDEAPYLVTLVRRVPGNIFLSHAKVFVFAEYWGVTRLRELSIQRLGKLLEATELTEAKVEDVAALMEYGYDEPRPEELTSLLLLYSASKIDKLWKSERFRKVVSTHGELAISLIGTMAETA